MMTMDCTLQYPNPPRILSFIDGLQISVHEADTVTRAMLAQCGGTQLHVVTVRNDDSRITFNIG